LAFCGPPPSIVYRPSSIVHRRQRCPIELVIKLKVPSWLERISLWLVLLYRRLRFGCAFRRIRLTQDKFAIVDPDDYPRLSIYRWHANKTRDTCYAQRKVWDAKQKKELTIKMHRQILNVPDSLLIDHINRNGLDNRKANLRPATYSQNVCNRPKSRYAPSRSKYKGLTWHKRKSKWHVRIRVEGRTISLGYFRDQIQAARAYDAAAREHHKDFAVLNFPNRRGRGLAFPTCGRG